MTENLYDSIHIKLFEDIINGEFNPTKARYNDAGVLKGLIEEANTIQVAVFPIVYQSTIYQRLFHARFNKKQNKFLHT